MGHDLVLPTQLGGHGAGGQPSRCQSLRLEAESKSQTMCHTGAEIKAEGWLGEQQRGSWSPAWVKSLRAKRIHDSLLLNS